MCVHCHCRECLGAMDEVQGFSLLEYYDNTRRTEEFNRMSEALARARLQHAHALRRGESERDIAKAQLHEAHTKLNEAMAELTITMAELTTEKAKLIKTEQDLKVSENLNIELDVRASRYRACISYGIVLLLIILLVYGRLHGRNVNNSPATMEDTLRAQIQILKKNIETLKSEKQSLAANARTSFLTEMQNLELDLKNTLLLLLLLLVVYFPNLILSLF